MQHMQQKQYMVLFLPGLYKISSSLLFLASKYLQISFTSAVDMSNGTFSLLTNNGR